MALKNLINGLDLINMLGIGKIIRRMGLEFSTIKMGISMREDGSIIRDMGKELFGSVILKIS